MYVCSKSLQQPRYLENLLAPIEEIDYFTFSNNNDILSPNEASKFHFCFWWRDMRQARRDQRLSDDFSTRGRWLLLSVSDIRKDTDISYAIMQICWSCTNRMVKHVYNDYVNTDMSYENFCELCHCCCQQKYGFVVIDKDIAFTNG